MADQEDDANEAEGENIDEVAIEADEDDQAEVEASEEEEEKKKGGKLKLIIIIVVALLVILGGTGGGLYYLGFLDSMLGIGHSENDLAEEPIDLGTPVYHEMAEFVADLKTNKCRSPYLKLALTIQIDQDDIDDLIDREPKIIDRIHQYLREKRRQDLVGEAGANTIRSEIAVIINTAIKPAKIQNVLFRSMVLQ